MRWTPNTSGYISKPYTLIRNSRGGFAVYLDCAEGMRLIHAEIEGARAAKAFVQCWVENEKRAPASWEAEPAAGAL